MEKYEREAAEEVAKKPLYPNPDQASPGAQTAAAAQVCPNGEL